MAGIELQNSFPNLFGEFSGNINHYLLLIGWKTLDNGTQVWLAQNSHGIDWEQDGVTEVALGFNSYGIESAVYTTTWRPEGRVEWSEFKAEIATNLNDKDATVTIFSVILGILIAFAVVLAFLLVVKLCRGSV